MSILGHENSKKIPIKVLHVFSPSFALRFGGATVTWKINISHWDNPDIIHYVLDTAKNQVVVAKEAFDFKYPEIQKRNSRWERAAWIVPLFRNLNKHQKEYDILHVHVLWWGGLLIGPWAKLRKIPALYESVLYESDTPTGIAKQRLGELMLACLRSYRKILAISEYLAEDYRKSGFMKDQVITLVNCVDSDLFSPACTYEEKVSIRLKLGLPKNAVVLLFVGSVIERKGVDILIRAFIGASSNRSDLYLLIIGPKNKSENPSIDENFINNLYLLLDEHNLSERVSFTGMIQDQQKLAEIYRAADIFVFPSNNEGLGNVILEAMASELPVVVSQLPVLEKIIKHGENGLFIPVGDVDAVKDSILALINDPSLSKKLGRAARNYVQEELNFIKWQTRLVEFYEELITIG